jgi:predicted metal-dependent hydrolase
VGLRRRLRELPQTGERARARLAGGGDGARAARHLPRVLSPVRREAEEEGAAVSAPPQTRRERVRAMVARIDAAIAEFLRKHPPLPEKPPKGRPRSPSRKGRREGKSFAPAAEADFSIDTAQARAASKRLACALTLYEEGKVSENLVRRYYQAYARAHLRYWLGGKEVDPDAERELWEAK